MRLRRGCGAVGIALLLWCSAYSQSTSQELPFFSSHATYIYLGETAPSPGGRNIVSLRVLDDNAEDFPSLVIVKTPHGQLTGKIAFGLNAQVLWNADSSEFAVTGSSEGANGQYHTSAFSIRYGKLVQMPLTRIIERAFGHPMKCGWPEAPNIAAVKWLDRRRLLVAAEIINHSNCDCFGTFKGYAVDVVDRSVVRVYDQIQVKRQFHADLGPWLQDANDDWVRNPRSCYVTANHPELHPSQ
jgi:hypothetical protein